MTWINDVGGMHGFGPVPVQAVPTRSGAWSARMWALNQVLIAKGLYSFDHYRHAVERMPPAAYLSSSSDLRRLSALETLVRERVVAERRGRAATAARPRPTPPARFAPGDAVEVRADSPVTHSRTPRYVRGRRGVVEALRGRSVSPEQRVAEDPAAPSLQIYSVRFGAEELWGAEGSNRCPVMLDLWESALDPAG